MDLWADTDEVLQAIADTAPTLMKDFPDIDVLGPWMPFLSIAITNVKAHMAATGSSLPDAATAVMNQMTPGQVNDPTLSGGVVAAAPDPSTIAAAASALAQPTADATQDAVATAVQALPTSSS